MRTRNQIALSVLLLMPLLTLPLFAQESKKGERMERMREAAEMPAPVRVNVNCNAPGVYHRHTHTGDALQVNFHSNGSCKLVNFSDPSIFGATEIQLSKGDNIEDIYSTGSTTFCVENQPCPPPAKVRKKRVEGTAGSRVLPASQELRPIVVSDPNEIIVP